MLNHEGGKMNELLALIGQIFLIVCVQAVMEMFIEQYKQPYLSKILSIACYSGALYLLLQFIFDNLLTEIFTLLRLGF